MKSAIVPKLFAASILGLLCGNVVWSQNSGSGCSQPDSKQAPELKENQGVKLVFRGYVRDVACLMKFNEALAPTNDCALMCARAGSPLVIVTKDGILYTRISESIPDTSVRDKLMPFVGSYVEVTGDVYERSGMKAVVIRQLKKTKETESR
ncbi:MAG: hypothetical protein WCB11_09155 [Terriglobales bacterium]